MPVQVLYDVLHSMSASINKSQTTQVIQKKPEETAEIYQPEPIASPVPEQKKKRKGRKSSAAKQPVPKSGALAAAMMAATVTGGTGFFDASKMMNIEETLKKKSDSTDSLTSATRHQSTPALVQSPALEKPSEDSSSEEIPAHIQVPSGPCLCECGDHLDKVESEVELNISAKQLYDLLFASDNTAIWETKTTAAGGKELRVGAWETVDDTSQRVLKYILPVSNPMGEFAFPTKITSMLMLR